MFSFFLINVCINSFLAFFTTALLIEGLIFLLRLKQGRFVSCLRMLPILKLPLDLFLYDFSNWSYLCHVNPLSCPTGSRTLFVGVHSLGSSIQGFTAENKTFTIADLVGYTLHPTVLNAISCLLILVGSYLLIKKLLSYRNFMKTLPILSNRIIHLPHYRGSPFVAGLYSSRIYIPTRLFSQLSQKEYEAVLAHESEHIRYKDPLIRFLLDCISSLFWWVPMKWLIYRIEEGQEVSCDSQTHLYNVDPLDLASAICKSVKYTSQNTKTFGPNLTKKALLHRTTLLLNRGPLPRNKTGLLRFVLALTIAVPFILLGRFWIF